MILGKSTIICPTGSYFFTYKMKELRLNEAKVSSWPDSNCVVHSSVL